MIVERAEFLVNEGQEAEFAAMMKDKGCGLLAGADGCHSVRCGRGVESPSAFILLLEWETVDHHTALTKTPAFAEFRDLAGPFFAGAPKMEHFDMA